MKRERARVARANAMAMRVTGVEEGEGGKVMALATRAMGKWTATAMTRGMVTKTKEAGDVEGNGKGSKSNVNGKKNGNQHDGDKSNQHQQGRP